MKKIFLILLNVILLTSCSSTLIQIVDVASDNVEWKDNYYVYRNSDCTIIYNFWDECGSSGFLFDNNTDEIIYLYLSKSFNIQNSQSFSYYKSREWTSSGSSTHSKSDSYSYSIGASARYSASRFGYWNTGYAGSQSYSGAVSANKGLATTFTNSFTSSKGLSIKEQPVIAIAPHSYTIVSEYKIMQNLLNDNSLSNMIKNQKSESVSYTSENTPIRFSNYICYKVGENGALQHVDNSFYVSSYKNKTITSAKESLIGSYKDEISKYLFQNQSPNRFYMYTHSKE